MTWGAPSVLWLLLGLPFVAGLPLFAAFLRKRAAARFGVSVSSASRWSERFHYEGQVAAKGRNAADEAKEATIANIIFLPFSLTKHSAIIADVKEYFGIDRHDNQLRLQM